MGERLSGDEVRATGISARFVFGRHPVYPTMRASMIDPDRGIALAWLDCAQITRVDGGIMVCGFEPQTGSADTAQVWWCVAVTAGQCK